MGNQDLDSLTSPGAEEIARKAAPQILFERESLSHIEEVIAAACRDYAASLEARLGEAQRDRGRAKRCIQEAYWANNQADIGVPKGEEFWANWQEDAAEILHGEPANENTVIRLNLKLTEAEVRADSLFLLLREVPTWIATSEREPEIGEWCFVIYAGHMQRMAARLSIVGSPDEVIAGNGVKEWRWDDNEADPCPLSEISHWMPLSALLTRLSSDTEGK